MKILQQLSLAGKNNNEDYFAANDCCAVIMDGATGLGNTNGPDAKWLCYNFARLFLQDIQPDGDIRKSVHKVLKTLYTLYITAGGGQCYPSASLIVVLQNRNNITVYNLGDCVCNIVFKDGTVQRIYDDRVSHLDNAVLDMAESMRFAGTQMNETLQNPEITAQLRKNRSKMNTPDGYDILAFNILPDGGRTYSFNADDIDRIVLCTDGFALMEQSLLQTDCRLAELGRQLRQAENEDCACTKYRRFKLHDDATAAIIMPL